jgi:hypothetical protein
MSTQKSPSPSGFGKSLLRFSEACVDEPPTHVIEVRSVLFKSLGLIISNLQTFRWGFFGTVFVVVFLEAPNSPACETSAHEILKSYSRKDYHPHPPSPRVLNFI